jgi:hydrogenase nickel incorporation protein HypA/HybF
MFTTCANNETEIMHELSIALSIIEIAEEVAARHGGKVTAVHLRLGQLSGVFREALLAAYDLACEATPLAGSKLLIEEVPVVIYCSQCDAEHALTSIQSLICPVCGAPAPDVVQGREMELAAMELDDLEMKHEHHTKTAKTAKTPRAAKTAKTN